MLKRQPTGFLTQIASRGPPLVYCWCVLLQYTHPAWPSGADHSPTNFTNRRTGQTRLQFPGTWGYQPHSTAQAVHDDSKHTLFNMNDSINHNHSMIQPLIFKMAFYVACAKLYTVAACACRARTTASRLHTSALLRMHSGDNCDCPRIMPDQLAYRL